MNTPKNIGWFSRVLSIASALFIVGTVTVAHAQNFTTYDLIVPVSSTAVLTTVDGIGRILPTNRSYVIGIDGGTRGAIVFQDWTASAEYPLIIVNRTGTGKVVVTDVGGATKRDGIAIKNCKYFQLRGDNDPAYRYGIEVAQVGSKVGHSHLGVAVGGASSDGEIMFVEVHDSGFAGIMVKSDPSCANPATWASNFVMNNINVHDNYVHDTGGEGMYLGYTHWPEPETCGAFGHEIHHLRVSYNLVANTGWESIQVASNPVDTRLFENVMFQAGLTPDSSGQGSNLQIGGGATGEYFNNVMIGAFYNNVSCTGQEGNVSVYNNLMAGALDYGIFAKNLPEPPPADPDARQTVPGSYVNFFNNTIVNPAHAAYYTLDHVSVNSFKNNICVIPNTAFTEILTGNGAVVNTAGNLLVRDTTTLAFVNESEKDYRILPASAAANVGVSLAGLPSPQISVTTDFEGKARPQGAAYDAGWNETGALSVYLVATPPSTTGGTGSIKASAIGGATPYTYVWSNSASTQTISGVSQGLYSVTVIDAVGAAMTKAVYLKDLAALGAPVRVTPPNEVLSPVLSPASGSFATSQIVTLNSGTAGSSIRYTTDGSIPTATTGTVYSGSILAANTTVVKAVAYKAGMDSSVLSTGTYIINNGPANAKFTGIVTTESAHSSSNVVARTLDGDLATSWGSNGDGNWVKYDLNAPQRLAFVSIAFPSGDVRTYTFDLQVSTDNTTWTDVLPGHKSPRALGLQVYDIPDIDPVRYVRIVCHGSTYNAGLNSIAEVEIWGGAAGSAVAPAITTQPQSQTASSGNNVALSVVATGAPSPTYQWRKNGTNLIGATSSTYNLVNVQPGDSGSYSVVVTNSSGSITSSPATLTVGTPPSLGIFQAENATLSGALVKSNQTGYTGTGFADYINLTGDYVEWSVSNPVSSSRTFTFRYASTGLARNLSITVNGVVVNGALAFATTGGANIWALKTMTVSLPAGTVLIRATATGTSGPNVDYLQID
jgi:hypothetical protein